MTPEIKTILRNQRAIMLALARNLEIAIGEPTTDASVHIANLYRRVRETEEAYPASANPE